MIVTLGNGLSGIEVNWIKGFPFAFDFKIKFVHVDHFNYQFYFYKICDFLSLKACINTES